MQTVNPEFAGSAGAAEACFKIADQPNLCSAATPSHPSGVAWQPPASGRWFDSVTGASNPPSFRLCLRYCVRSAAPAIFAAKDSDTNTQTVTLPLTVASTPGGYFLIAAENVEFQIANLAGWRFTPLLEQVGTLPAMSSIVIPVVAEQLPPGTPIPKAGDEDCWSFTKAIYEVLCRQYRNRKEVKAWLHDDTKCPPPAPPPVPPTLPAWVTGWIRHLPYPPGGASSSGTGNPPPPSPVPGGPRQQVVWNTATKPDNKIPWQCNPCVWDVAGVLAGCAWDLVVPIPDIVNCGRGAAGVVQEPSVMGVASTTVDCLAAAGHEIPVVGTALTLAGCLQDLLNTCGGNWLSGLFGKKKDAGQPGATPHAAKDQDPADWPASLHAVRANANRLVAVINYWHALLGDEAWFHPAQGTNFSAWLGAFRDRIATHSPAGRRVTEAERAELLSLPWPDGLAAANLTAFLDRWNRTLDYEAQGIRNLAEVPAGWNSDFIARDVFTNAVLTMAAAVDAAQAEGFADPISAVLRHVQSARQELSGQSEGVCGHVKLRLNQEAVISRDAFKATLEVENQTGDALTEVAVDVVVMNAAGQVVNELFGIRDPELVNLNAVDGTGVIGAGATSAASWILIPASDAAPETATVYYVSGVLRYRQQGVQVFVPLSAEAITVHPNPRLFVKYFHQRDVHADDPFTDVVEPSVPFSLAVMVDNRGFGEARNLRITSAQPEIIENEKGLLVDFKIIASEVEGQAMTPSLTVNLGNIGAGQRKIGRWLLTSTLQGLFTDYKATFEHLDSLGN
ncbi:MAG TPA: hypothetical protein VI136_23660, partial [Verrucomicrobiae bacterium]